MTTKLPPGSGTNIKFTREELAKLRLQRRINHKAKFFASNKAAKREKELNKTLKADLVIQEALAIFDDIAQAKTP